MNKLFTMTAAAMLLAFPAMGQTIGAAVLTGPTTQVEFLNVSAANTANIGFVNFNVDNTAQAFGNSYSDDVNVDTTLFGLVATGATTQVSIGAIHLAQTANAGVLNFNVDNSAVAASNISSRNVEIDSSALVLVAHGGTTQLSAGTINGAQTLNAGAFNINVTNTAAAAANISNNATQL